jgi:CRISPR-associated endoribonuclease Cas6
MHSSIITVDLRLDDTRTRDFYGSIARGWFGSILKCNDGKDCRDCIDLFECPYYMIFKEKTDIKPYCLLSISTGNHIRNIIRVHGDRRRLVPKITGMIHHKGKLIPFGEYTHTLESIHACEIETIDAVIGERTEIVFLSPTSIVTQNSMEIMPSFTSILNACARTYNRICKYYDAEKKFLRVDDSILKAYAPIVTYDVRSIQVTHEKMYDKKIFMEGIIGSITYDTSAVPPEAGTILKIGELLQIGKHTTYGFGGMYVKGSM